MISFVQIRCAFGPCLRAERWVPCLQRSDKSLRRPRMRESSFCAPSRACGMTTESRTEESGKMQRQQQEAGSSKWRQTRLNRAKHAGENRRSAKRTAGERTVFGAFGDASKDAAGATGDKSASSSFETQKSFILRAFAKRTRLEGRRIFAPQDEGMMLIYRTQQKQTKPQAMAQTASRAFTTHGAG